MSRVKLTKEQITVSASREPRLFVEATPGSGKTTVAAERYGVLCFNLIRDSCDSITAVSFTRSAKFELHRKVRRRWGSKVLEWPQCVNTIDGLICDIVHHLLRCRAIRWLGGHTTIETLDNWYGHSGYRPLKARKGYRRIVTLDDNACLTSSSQRVLKDQFGFGNKDQFHSHLRLGRCTHEDMRSVLAATLQVDRLRSKIKSYLKSTIAHLLVDEIFDANDLDLALVDLCCEEDIDLTIVGDPWQALYEFRGATPQRVRQTIERWNFTSLPLSQSFRFQSDKMIIMSELLRNSQPVHLNTDGRHGDVVLASKWDRLWQGPNHILPLSFGRAYNKDDAAAILLLVVCL